MEFRKWLPALAIAVGLLVSGFAMAQASDTASVYISIPTIGSVTVLPTYMNWTGLTSGGTGGVINLSVMNAGTVNISDVFIYASTNEDESVRPFGLGAANYSSSGMIVIKNASASKFYFAQRKEWNQTTPIPNIDLSNLGAARSRVATGYFRNASFEYIWAAVNGTNSTQAATSFECNNSGSLFAIEDDIDTGVAATRTPTTTGIVRDGTDANYAYYSVNRATSPIAGYCVAVRADCSHILIYKYDKRSGYNICANADYFREADLTPGSSDDLFVDAWVANGVAAGQLAIGNIVISSTSA